MKSILLFTVIASITVQLCVCSHKKLTSTTEAAESTTQEATVTSPMMDAAPNIEVKSEVIPASPQIAGTAT
ncbi:unnamed protein product [Pieris brassicae]|uniref:Uncharacterized protein n=1 Tax=Pieris brassicae TaxID=7116 RepID=A0A9P0XG04_PIEBR|nr:unnamed protein product [Pieris brassicae]